MTKERKTDWVFIKVTPTQKRVLEGLSQGTRLPMSEILRRSIMQASAQTILGGR